VYSLLSSKSAGAPAAYVTAALKAMRYFQLTKDVKMKLGGVDEVIEYFVYADASFIRDGQSKSYEAYCSFLGFDSACITSKVASIKNVCISSCEAEIRSCVTACIECLHMRQQLNELGFPQLQPTIIYQDNTAVISLVLSIGNERRSKHVINYLNFLREHVESKAVQLIHMPTKHMVADILTGPRSPEESEYLFKILMRGHIEGNHPLGIEYNKKQ